MKRIGIFSGTFDPVHEGHLQFAREALRQCSLDKVFFLIEPRPRRKQGVKSFEHRVNMARLAVENEPGFGVIVLEHARFNVIETLPALTSRFQGAELNMLLGDDVLIRMAEWPHIDDLVKAVVFIVGVRDSEVDVKQSIQQIEKARGLKFNYRTFTTDLSSVSSSVIRTALRGGKEPAGLPPKVFEYIKHHGLYAPSTSS